MHEFRPQNINWLRLPTGRVQLQLQALSIPGDVVSDLDTLRQMRLDNPST